MYYNNQPTPTTDTNQPTGHEPTPTRTTMGNTNSLTLKKKELKEQLKQNRKLVKKCIIAKDEMYKFAECNLDYTYYSDSDSDDDNADSANYTYETELQRVRAELNIAISRNRDLRIELNQYRTRLSNDKNRFL